MSDRPTDLEDDEALQESVLSWLDEVAETEGMTREEAAESLVSSYWQLEEVVDLLDQHEAPGPTRAEGTDPDGEAMAVEEPESSLAADSEELRQFLEPVMEIADRLEKLESALQPSDGEDPPLQELEARLDSVERDIANLRQVLIGLRDQSVTADQLERAIEHHQTVNEDLGQQHDDLRDRVITEFEYIRTILSHLVNVEPEIDPATVDRLESRVDTHLAERERVASIARTASRLGIRQADCEYCGRALDLALLDEPRCPYCEHDFEDVRAPSGLFSYFRSPVLEVANGSDESPRD